MPTIDNAEDVDHAVIVVRLCSHNLAEAGDHLLQTLRRPVSNPDHTAPSLLRTERPPSGLGLLSIGSNTA